MNINMSNSIFASSLLRHSNNGIGMTSNRGTNISMTLGRNNADSLSISEESRAMLRGMVRNQDRMEEGGERGIGESTARPNIPPDAFGVEYMRVVRVYSFDASGEETLGSRLRMSAAHTRFDSEGNPSYAISFDSLADAAKEMRDEFKNRYYGEELQERLRELNEAFDMIIESIADMAIGTLKFHFSRGIELEDESLRNAFESMIANGEDPDSIAAFLAELRAILIHMGEERWHLILQGNN